MGTLALTNASSGNNNVLSMSGRLRVLIGAFTFSSSYATGGEAFDLAASYPGLVKSVTVVTVPAAGGNTFQYDSTTKKLLAYAGSSQVAATTNLSTLGALPFIAFIR